MVRPLTRSFGAVMAAAALAACVGCAPLAPPSLEQEVHQHLAARVDDAPRDLWPYRYDLSTDPEAALSRIGFVGDARPAFADPPSETSPGTYTLLAVSSSPDGATLTLATTGGATSGGGLFLQSATSAVCFTLRFPAGERAIHTDASDCADGAGHGLDDLPNFWSYDDVVPLDDLDVRRVTTDDDIERLPCQCSSGGSCDCPGG